MEGTSEAKKSLRNWVLEMINTL